MKWVNKKYLTTFSPKVFGMFVYRSTTSKVAITVFPSRFVKFIKKIYTVSNVAFYMFQERF